jgi:PAS domain S-box-containing protein
MKKPKILIVEDNKENSLLIHSILETTYVSIFEAANGKEGMEQILEYLPDLILLDVILPDTDGFEICKKLKDNILTRQIPVIFVSAINDEAFKIKGFQSGGIDYVSKPFYPKELLSRVQTHLKISMLQQETEIQNIQLKKEIVEKLEAEKLLKESEERYRLISSAITDYIFSTKLLPNGELESEWIAGAFECISGYSFEEFIQRGGWRSTVHPDDYLIDDNDMVRLKNNQNTESEIRTINKNGNILWVQVFAQPIWNYEQNCLIGIFGAVKDITERKAAEEKLINSESRFRELLETVNLIAVQIDTGGIITFCNDFLLNLTGYKREELIGKNWFNKLIPTGNTDVYEVFINETKHSNTTPYYENPILTKAGKLLDIAWSNTTQHDLNGNITGVACIGENITERKNTEARIRMLNEELEQRVLERTSELEEKNAELARINKLFVGRELQMIELKRKIKELESLLKTN